jgi:hypothetical protein
VEKNMKMLVILGLVVVASLFSGCAGGASSSLPLEDSFTDCSKGWSTDTDEFVSLSCTGGDYRVLIKNPLWPQNARLFLGEGVSSLSVEADATRRAGPRTIGSDEYLVYGVGCWRSQVQGYVFLISPDGAWGIEKITTGTSTPATLAEGATSNAIPGLARTNRIRGVCLGGRQEPTKLSLQVNGRTIAATQDPDGFDSFPGLGFFVYSSELGTDIRFDNLVARELADREARRSGQAPEPSPESPSTCKREGIRYAGTTSQGAEVCFTLTPNRRAWVEIGFRFVRASGCPNAATATAYTKGPVSLSGPGRIEIPGTFTASIRGDSASGVFQDSDICGRRNFSWSARRTSGSDRKPR